jgi:hypothetical protein
MLMLEGRVSQRANPHERKMVLISYTFDTVIVHHAIGTRFCVSGHGVLP